MTEELRKLAEKIDWKDPDSVIEFYEQNIDAFSDFKLISNEEEIIELLSVKFHYVNSLIEKSRFRKAQLFISDIDILNQKIKHNKDLFKKYEEEKDFLLGLTYGRLKKYSESADIFYRLIKIDPENDNYKEWYLNMRIKNVNKQTIVVSIIGFLIVVGVTILKTLFHIQLHEYIFIFGITIVFLSILFPYIYRQWIRTKIVWK